MKYVLSLLSLCFIFACGGETNTTEEVKEDPVVNLPIKEQLRLKIKEELASEKQIDTIILDHRFGMSRKQVIRHKNLLVQKKRIYPVYKTKMTRAFVYDIDLRDDGKVPTYFDTFYHKDEMYIMECKPKIPKNSTAQKVMAQSVALFSRKYGDPHFVLPVDGVEGCERAIWIDANLQIEIRCTEKEALITYTDLRRELKKLEDI